MSKKPTPAADAQPGLDIPEPDRATEIAKQAEAQRLATEEAEADRLAAEQAAKVEADRLAAEQAAKVEADRLAALQATGVLTRREHLNGQWVPLGTVLTASAELCRALRDDGALDPHPDAIAHAQSSGAPSLVLPLAE